MMWLASIFLLYLLWTLIRYYFGHYDTILDMIMILFWTQWYYFGPYDTTLDTTSTVLWTLWTIMDHVSTYADHCTMNYFHFLRELCTYVRNDFKLNAYIVDFKLRLLKSNRQPFTFLYFLLHISCNARLALKWVCTARIASTFEVLACQPECVHDRAHGLCSESRQHPANATTGNSKAAVWLRARLSLCRSQAHRTP